MFLNSSSICLVSDQKFGSCNVMSATFNGQHVLPIIAQVDESGRYWLFYVVFTLRRAVLE